MESFLPLNGLYQSASLSFGLCGGLDASRKLTNGDQCPVSVFERQDIVKARCPRIEASFKIGLEL
jgi:hypothetical protein